MAQVSRLTIDSSKIAADLTDFPVYVDLSDMNAEFWATVANGGGDIRVFKSDGTTELPREVVSCDTSTETGELHFKYTGTLSSSVDTEVKIHADGVSSDYATTDTYGAENVWSDYNGVFHFEGSVTNSVGSNNGTASNISYTASKIGDGADFNGTNSKITLPDATLTATINHTVSFWVKKDASPSSRDASLFEKFSGSTSQHYGIPSIVSEPSGAITMKNRDNGGGISGGDFMSSASIGTQYHIAYRYNSTASANGTFYGYVDGSIASTSDNSRAITDYDRQIAIGKSDDSFLSSYFDGTIDEMRIREDDLGADWITTEYNNQNSPSTFYTAEASMLTVNITDTMSLLETTTLPRSLLFSQTDTIEMTDSASLLKVIFVNIVETIGLSEATSSVRSRVISIIDSLGLDEIAQARKKIRNLSKNIAIGISNRVKNSMTVKNRSKS